MEYKWVDRWFSLAMLSLLSLRTLYYEHFLVVRYSVSLKMWFFVSRRKADCILYYGVIVCSGVFGYI